jgi:para-aminobenzoate synthetase/4-amino-4-deoxychorismate lyase
MKTLPAPDPAHGLFETLLVLDGEPVELDAHLERMATSLRELFGAELPPGLATSARERADTLCREQGGDPSFLGRMRIAVVVPVAPSDGDAARVGQTTLAAEDVDPADFFPGWERAVELRSLRRPGGLGSHKWADREGLAEARGEPVPLLFDRGDEVLEAGRGNVFAASEGALRTPPADGRILPGTVRAAAIEVARAEGIELREERLTRDDLFAAEEVFLTGSVRGVEPALSLDGAPLPGGDELRRRIGEGLLRRWRAAQQTARRRATTRSARSLKLRKATSS